MQIEKINSHKLKVVLSATDLEENNIDVNHFMANSLESQELFLDILDLAEEEFNFYVDNSKLVVEAISLANNIFVFTITKLCNTREDNAIHYIYYFQDFNSLYQAFSALPHKHSLKVYTYDDQFYCISHKADITSHILNEFCTQKLCSGDVEQILAEHGTKITL